MKVGDFGIADAVRYPYVVRLNLVEGVGIC